MELDASQLYGEKNWVKFNAAPSATQQRQLLESARQYGQGMALPDVTCTLETVSASGVLQLRRNKALVISADLDPYQFEGIITLHCFGDACVLGVYKQLLGAEFFALNHSADARRRSVIQHLGALHAVDFFFLVDKMIDQLGDLTHEALLELMG